MIISHFPSGTGGGGGMPQFTYTGTYDIITEPEGWRIKFLTSGTFTPKSAVDVDIFCVGGGGDGTNYYVRDKFKNSQGLDIERTAYGYGGGGGYTHTETEVSLSALTAYTVIVGDSGESSVFKQGDTVLCTANGGSDGANVANGSGGNGGSGGASGGYYSQYAIKKHYYNGKMRVEPGTDGANGEQYTGTAGTGQGTTTREFGEISGDLYASGGASTIGPVDAPMPNTGDGGAGGRISYTGASGIVIIRNARG